MSELVVEVRARGFQTRKVERLRVEVARKLTQDFQLEVGDVAQEVTVTTTPGDLIERATISVGHVIDREEVQTLPLNGRYFLDLGLLVPGNARFEGSFKTRLQLGKRQDVEYFPEYFELSRFPEEKHILTGARPAGSCPKDQ
jgi:hypothetical protein